MFLLAEPPFDDVDKITSTYIDGVSVQGDENPFAFFFDSGELVADETILQNIHPPIRSI